MNLETSAKTPWHLWAVGIITLLWNAIGIFSYMMTRLGKLPDLGMTPDQIAFFDSFPVWANSLWALGVWGAFFGSILILLRSRWAIISLIISVIGMIGTTIYQNFMITVPEELQSIGLNIAIWVTTLFMLWYAIRMRNQGVLK